MNPYRILAQGGVRAAASRALWDATSRQLPNGQAGAEPDLTVEPSKKTPHMAKQMELEPEECCCVCYEQMSPDDNLTFCKF
mmetsp:Transcript_40687/g.62077  ORF Transcript_40687/g.62077 Transcript_40687/m.62077 type:complete len:81 (+) Transcript_40687:335-577(+)